MEKKNVSLDFSLKNIDKGRNCFLEEIKNNELISKKHKKSNKTLNYVEHLLVLASLFSGSVSISAFASVFGIPAGITSSAVGFKMGIITTRIKKYKSIIKKKRNKHEKIAFKAKTKLNSIEVLISEVLINSFVIHD